MTKTGGNSRITDSVDALSYAMSALQKNQKPNNNNPPKTRACEVYQSPSRGGSGMNNKQESSQVRKALERVRNQIVDSCSVYHESPKDINGVDCVSVEDINNWFDSELSRIEEEVCEWKSVAIGYSEDDAWETSCDSTRTKDSDYPEEMEINFCPNCGKKIKVIEDE